MKKIVIIGGGFAGAYAAQALERTRASVTTSRSCSPGIVNVAGEMFQKEALP